MTPRRVAIVQARMGSSRLPGKVLADIHGRPLLARMLDRLARAEQLDEAVVATTVLPEDDPVAELCRARGTRAVRGHPIDVLDRYHQAAEAAGAQVIVRLTGDCPLIDPELVDLCVRTYLEADPPVDLVVNRLPWDRSYPIGLDTEVFGREALETAWREAKEPHQREHVVPFLYENPARFTMIHLEADGDYGAYRWTVDEPPDLEAVRRIYAGFGGRDDFGWRQVLELMEHDPALAAINAGVSHKTHRDSDERIG
jgi:spore coat polysaccharide biosynthesis protein SpsF